MNKVYFSKEKKHWFVSEPEDLYTFKTVNYETNEEVNQILSWSRGFDMEKYPKHIRVYDVEIDGIKYFFLMRNEGVHYIIESENPVLLERLIDEKKIFFTGNTSS